MVKKVLMGRKIFEHIYECPGIRLSVLFGCPQQHSHGSRVSSEVLIVTTYVVTVLCLPGVSGHSLLETTQIPKGVFVDFALSHVNQKFCNWFLKRRWLERQKCMDSLYLFFCLFFIVKKAKQKINSLIRSQLLVSVDMQKLIWVASFVLLEAFLSAVTVVKFLLLGDAQIFHPHP